MLPGRRADNGSIFVVQGPAPAGALMEGGIAVTPLGAIYISELATSFSPIDLFQNNEQGAWYDPSDLSTMFQDAAGTTPVTADGQPVGLILDKSGRGNHAIQATAAKRPLYKTSGGLHWLQFDGVNNSLSTAAINLTGMNKASLFLGMRKIDDSTRIVAEFSDSWVSNNGSFVFVSGNDAGFSLNSGSRGAPTVSADQIGGSTTPAPLTAVASTTHNIPGDLTTFRENAVDKTSATGDKGTGNFGSYPLYIGSRAGTGFFFNSNIYSLIILGRLATTQEITDTETWVANKTGVTLP